MHACLPACRPACPFARPPACLPSCLLGVCLFVCWLVFSFVHEPPSSAHPSIIHASRFCVNLHLPLPWSVSSFDIPVRMPGNVKFWRGIAVLQSAFRPLSGHVAVRRTALPAKRGCRRPHGLSVQRKCLCALRAGTSSEPEPWRYQVQTWGADSWNMAAGSSALGRFTCRLV